MFDSTIGSYHLRRHEWRRRMTHPEQDSLQIQGVQVAVIAANIDSSTANCWWRIDWANSLKHPSKKGKSGTGERGQSRVLSVLVRHRPHARSGWARRRLD